MEGNPELTADMIYSNHVLIFRKALSGGAMP